MSCSSHSSPNSPGEFVATELSKDRGKYMAFLMSRLRDETTCEDILQAAFVRAVEKAETLRERAALQGWFYGILRNAVVDAQRRKASSAKALESFFFEHPQTCEVEDAPDAPCHCVVPLAQGLKDEYQSALLRIDIEGVAVKAYAEEAGLTANNAGVRVHRARQALKKRVSSTCGSCASAGCLNCTCEKP